jgi:plasmid replication initiation protein
MKLKHATTGPSLLDRHVSMHNDLLVASHGLKTLAEQRIVKSCAAKIDSVRLDQHNRYKVRLTAKEYAETFNLDTTTAYEQLKSGCETLAERWITWTEPVTRGGIAVNKDRWVSGATYVDKAGWVELRFSPEATPYLVVLRGNHTTYLLRQASELRSIYSWRLLELLMQFKDTGWRQMPIKEFLHAMDAKPSHLQNFKDARKQIIEVAVEELQKKDGWLINWSTIKEGRKVTQIRFEFSRNPQGQLALEDTSPPVETEQCN